MALNYVTFNQDYSHLAVGTSAGFRIYYTDPFSLAYANPDYDVSLLSMLFSTSLVAVVLSPRRLVIRNTKRNSTICELTFPTTVLGVRLNRKRLVVVLEDQIYVYDISNMKLVDTVDTSPNPNGICALTPTHDPSYLVYPLPQPTAPPQQQLPSHVPPSTHSPAQPQSGSLLIADATTHTPLNVIEAHRAPLSCIAVSSSGTLLATASEKGTIIRVFELPSGKKLAQFRRGTMPARVCSMAFNGTGSLLVVSSVTETVHVFKLSDGARGLAASNFLGGRPAAHTRTGSRTSMGSATLSDDEPGSPGFDSDAARPTPAHRNPSGSADMAARAHDGSFSGMLRRTSQSVGKTFAASVAGYLPTSVTEMLEPARDFAWFKLPRVGSSGADVSSPGADSNHNNSNNGGGNGRDASPPTTTGRMSHLVGFGSRAAAGALGAATGSGGGGSAAHGPLKSVVGMSRNAPQVMAVTSEGMFLVYNIDLEHGGEGVLVRKSSILDDSGDSLSAARAFAGSDASRGMPTGPAGMAARRRSSVRDGESGLAGMGLSP